MEPKKLLFVYYKLFNAGGITRVLVNLVNELVKENFDITILVMTNNTDSYYELDSRIKVINIDTYDHWAFTVFCVGIDKYAKWLPKRKNVKSYLYDFGAYQVLDNWLNQNHHPYDTIITCMYKLSSQVAINKKINKKTIAWEHTDHNVGGGIYKKVLRKHYKYLKGIVSINQPSFQYYTRLNDKTHLIPNIIGEPFESLGKPIEKQNLITYVGRLDQEKNVIELLQILKTIDLSPEWKFQIIGDGPQRRQLENFVKENAMSDLVVFHGIQSSHEISMILQNSKIFVFASLKEALPTVLIEAMFCGNALISYNCNYGPSDIINEKNGFLINLHDQKKFGEKLKFLISNPLELDKLNESSYENSNQWRKEKNILEWKSILN